MLHRLLLVLIVVSGCQSLPAQQTDESDRGKARLVGPVATVKVESTYFKRENGKWVESEREVYEESVYDKSGRLVNQKKIPMYGDPAPCRLERKYDDKQRVTHTFCQGDPAEKILWKYAYEDDRFGNWIRQLSSVPEGDAFRVQSIIYRTITYFD